MSTVTFKQSGLTATWDDEHDSILELAEDEGLNLDFGCRSGSCTSCQQTILSGEIEYPDGHDGEPDKGKVLICCSIPKGDIVIEA